jgi:hypothetical protein
MARAAGAGARNALTATEIVHAIAAGETTCEAVVRDCLDRIEQRETIIHAWAGIDPEPIRQKRPCQHPGCGNHIPLWRKGRKVSARAKFCDQHSH